MVSAQLWWLRINQLLELRLVEKQQNEPRASGVFQQEDGAHMSERDIITSADITVTAKARF